MALKIPNLSKENCTRIAEGPNEAVMLAMLRVGLGAVIHSLPAISQLIRDGFNVTVNCRTFQRPIFEAIGATVTTISEPFGMSWYEQNKNTYGRIVSLAAWDIWECQELGFHESGTMQQIADILDVQLPESFSWIDILKPETIEGKPYILFNPNAIERWRSLPQDVAERIGKEIEQFGDVVQINGDECDSWEELRDLIFNASAIVCVEGGVSNVAGAFGKKMLCLTGMTETDSTVRQYLQYIPELQFEAVKGFQPEGCSMPCYRQSERGFINDRCLGKHDLPQCLVHLDVSKVAERFSTLNLNEPCL